MLLESHSGDPRYFDIRYGSENTIRGYVLLLESWNSNSSARPENIFDAFSHISLTLPADTTIEPLFSDGRGRDFKGYVEIFQFLSITYAIHCNTTGA